MSNPASHTTGTSPGTGRAVRGPALRKVTVAASIGSFIEYFDLVIYGALATVLAHTFFPADNEVTGLLNTFAVFAVAFVARPLGGLLWGPLGDRIGRRRTLATIIVVMALASGAIGLIPSYQTIGLLAPLSLVILRFIQGISVGGEFPGAAIYIGEYSPDHRRAFQASFLQWGVIAGQTSALLVAAALTSTLSTAAMRDWGWRIPFLLAIPLGAVGLYIRSRIGESPAFERADQAGETTKRPLKAVLGHAEGWKMIGRTALFNLPSSVPAYLLVTFMPAYLTSKAHLSSGAALMSVVIAVLFAMVVQPIAALLSDRFGRRPMLLALCVITLVVAYPAFALLQMGGHLLPTLGLIVIGLVHGIATGCMVAPALESFPTRLRFTGYAWSFGLTTALVAGPTPYIATWLISVTGSVYSPAWLVMAGAIPSLIGVFFLRESHNRPLPS